MFNKVIIACFVILFFLGYEAYLKDLLEASQAGFGSLCLRANQLKREIPPLTLKEKGNFVSDIDEKSQKLIPTGKLNGEYVALRTKGDGNCLYRAASILACGHERKHLEMRVRTVVELACHKSHYLNVPNIEERICAIEQYIQRKSSREGRDKYSEELNKSVLEVDFEEEVRDTCKYSAWASDWHLQVLPTIFRRPVKIVFPEGIRELDEFFNDIRPRDRCSMLEPLVIMWTSTEPSEEMVLNHFVPLVPLGNVCSLGKGKFKTIGMFSTVFTKCLFFIQEKSFCLAVIFRADHLFYQIVVLLTWVNLFFFSFFFL